MLSTESLTIPKGTNWIEVTNISICDIQNVTKATVEYSFTDAISKGSRLLTNQWVEGVSNQSIFVRSLNQRQTTAISIVRNT